VCTLSRRVDVAAQALHPEGAAHLKHASSHQPSPQQRDKEVGIRLQRAAWTPPGERVVASYQRLAARHPISALCHAPESIGVPERRCKSVRARRPRSVRRRKLGHPGACSALRHSVDALDHAHRTLDVLGQPARREGPQREGVHVAGPRVDVLGEGLKKGSVAQQRLEPRGVKVGVGCSQQRAASGVGP